MREDRAVGPICPGTVEREGWQRMGLIRGTLSPGQGGRLSARKAAILPAMPAAAAFTGSAARRGYRAVVAAWRRGFTIPRRYAAFSVGTAAISPRLALPRRARS